MMLMKQEKPPQGRFFLDLREGVCETRIREDSQGLIEDGKRSLRDADTGGQQELY
jgi:hypothetical protein